MDNIFSTIRFACCEESSEQRPLPEWIYTRNMAFADGALIDAMQPPFAEVSSQHLPQVRLAMTRAVHDLISSGGANEKGMGGTWHQILWMARSAPTALLPNGRQFRVMLPHATGGRWHDLKLVLETMESEIYGTVLLTNEE